MQRREVSQRLLTLREVAELINVCERTVMREVQKGRFPSPIKIGRQNRWDVEVIDSFIANATRSPG